MAKSLSILNLQGTIGGVTHVQSKTYKPHIRKGRSSREINVVFQENNRQMAVANMPARLIKNTIDLYRGDFNGGQFWQVLVGYFKKQVKAKRPFDVMGLRNVEVNKNYPLNRMFSEAASCSIDHQKGVLRLTVRGGAMPNFKRKYIDGYKLSAIAVFPDFERGKADSVMKESPIMPLNLQTEDVFFDFEMDDTWKQYLLCLKIAGCSKGEVCVGDSIKGMRIVDVGERTEEKG